MATLRTYYEKPYLRETTARVVSIEPVDQSHLDILLDHSIFYPEGGGQPSDTGTIAGLPVERVDERGADVVHRVRADAREADTRLAAGAAVACVVDLDARIDRSEQHTAQHLLSAVLLRMLQAQTLSFHLGAVWSSIDVDLAAFDRADAGAVEDEVMRIIRDRYAVITHRCPPEDPSSFPLRKDPAVEADVLRVVEIDGIEYSACCGTHVADTGALGAFRIVKTEKYKGGTRIHFVAGGRASADYRRLATLVRESASAGLIAEDGLPAAIAGWHDRIKALEQAVADANDRLAELRSGMLDEASPAGAIVRSEAAGVDEGTRLARALASRGRVSIIACPAELKVVAASPSAAATDDHAASLDIGSALGPVARSHGGKGGGGKTFFQAAFTDRAALDSFLAALGNLSPRQVPAALP